MADLAITSALSACAGEVLETMFFTMVVEEEEEAPGAGEPLRTRLTFAGAPPGAFTLVIPVGAARQVAANFLAEDEEVLGEEQVAEVVLELTNMICGATLSRVLPQVNFELTAPERARLPVPPRGEVYCKSVPAECGKIELCLEFWPPA